MTTYFAISGAPVQYEISSGVPASGYVLKAYAAGTSTPINIATDYAGGTLVSTVTLNASGYPAVSGNIVIPHIAQNYKLTLYPSQSAANANTGAIWTIDNNQIGGNGFSQGSLTDVASAATISLNSDLTNYFNVTGTTTITAITLAEGSIATVKFAGALTVTNGGFLINIGAANITTSAGDIAVFRGEAGGLVRMLSYTKAGSLYAPVSAPTFTGKVTTAASEAATAGLNLPHGADPTSPVNGDLWTKTTGVYVRVNGTTYKLQERIIYTLGGAVGVLGNGYCRSTTQARIFIPFKFHLATAPTGITVANVANFAIQSSSAVDINCSAINFVSATLDGIVLDCVVAAGLTAGDGTMLNSQNVNAEITLTGGSI
jgi:hypothetical protein